LKIGTLEYNETHEIAADIMLGAEMSLKRGKKRRAAECAQFVLDLPGCDDYYPAARQMLKRCGTKVKRAAKEAVGV
jgi:hypothetical protein